MSIEKLKEIKREMRQKVRACVSMNEYVRDIHPDTLDDFADDISAVIKEMEEQKPEDCPNCPNRGWYADYNQHTGEPEQVQCEFCYTNPRSRFNVSRSALGGSSAAPPAVDKLAEALRGLAPSLSEQAFRASMLTAPCHYEISSFDQCPNCQRNLKAIRALASYEQENKQ